MSENASGSPEPPVLCPTSVGRLAWVAGGVIGLAFGGLALWSAFAPLGSAAIAGGTVVVDTNRKTVQHLEGGMVRRIHVRDGDRVEAGDVLIEIDDARVRAAVATLQPLLSMSRAQKARLEAERRGSDEIVFPASLTNATDPSTVQIVSDQERVFRARRAALNSRLATLANRKQQAEAALYGLRRMHAAQGERIALTREELADVQGLVARGITPAKRVLELRRALAELESEQANVDVRIGEAEKVAERQTLEAQQAQTAFDEAVEAELQTVEREIHQLLERMRTFEDQAERLAVRAPVSGIVVNMGVHTEAGVIAPGGHILDIVPDEDRLVVEARVSPNDIQDIRPGQTAEIRFPTLGRRDLERLLGKVTIVSADRLTDAVSGHAYFLARVAVDEATFGHFGGIEMRPGMPVEVIIVKSERTVLSYLVAPLANVLTRALRE
jgi:HlyD family type I secretion membrane fusion protein